MWELFSYGKLPYEGISNQDVLSKVLGGYRLPNPNCGEEICAIMMSCWKINPSERPTFAELLKELQPNLVRAVPPAKKVVDTVNNSSNSPYFDSYQ